MPTPNSQPRTPAAAKPPAPGWGECPPAELPLRKALPKFRDETAERLVKFGLSQPEGVKFWLGNRSLSYWKATDEELVPMHFTDAVACLDLLTWQAGGMADKAALERLPTEAELYWTNADLRQDAGSAASNVK